jgi:hypothetical protein
MGPDGNYFRKGISIEMTIALTAEDQIRNELAVFQDYYTRRNPDLLDEFIKLMDEDLEVIGTNAIQPSRDEWYLDRDAAREIFLGDWEGWGDVRLDVPGARIRAHGEVAWLSCAGTVEMKIETEKGYADYLAFVKKYIDSEGLTAEQKLVYLLRGGTNTLYELRRGEKFVWPFRFTAVLKAGEEGWKFQQMQFSFPTIYFPDARIVGQAIAD